jgi:formylglycine-generating enzyme required for sulfatase activity
MERLLQIRENREESYTPDLPEGFREEETFVMCLTDQSKMIRIPKASFSMGGEEDDAPCHEVQLSSFLIDQYPVTNGQFSWFIEDGGYQRQELWSLDGWQWKCQNNMEGPERFVKDYEQETMSPIVGVSWYEAQAYAHWAGKSLPTEAQWEYAAAGKEKNIYPWGEKNPCLKLANFGDNAQATVPVDSLPEGASSFGCHQMAGNVWEWCYDWYMEDYYHQSTAINPIGPSQGDEKVCRGGSWTYSDVEVLRTYYRFYGSPSLRDRGYGFRCARIL